MSNDHRALIEIARKEHRPFELDGQTVCYGCTVGSDDGHMEGDSGPYPCITARLADALEGAEQQSSVTLEAKVNQTIFDLAQERDAALGHIAQAEQSAASWQDEARAAYLKRDEIRGHYDAVREQVGVLAQRLAAAREALEEAEAERDQLRAAIDAAWATTQATLAPSPAPCASCGQDPAGGHNLGCPSGAGLGGGP